MAKVTSKLKGHLKTKPSVANKDIKYFKKLKTVHNVMGKGEGKGVPRFKQVWETLL